MAVIENSRFELTVGKPFNRGAFEEFIRNAGYVEEGVADDPGEFAVRDEVIDIFPAGGTFPMRIVLSDDDRVLELRSYDPATQRTDNLLETVVVGPASEAIAYHPETVAAKVSDSMERLLVRTYETMPTVFDIIGDARVAFAPGTEERVAQYWDIIDDARQARVTFAASDSPSSRSLYLSREEWKACLDNQPRAELDLRGGHELPSLYEPLQTHKAVLEFAQKSRQDGRKVVVAGGDALSMRSAAGCLERRDVTS
uniref:hypothetical protein n=1 Tax=Neorhizobium sp. EC2-8 TaxID=3129230 RepID=UPI003100B69C